MWSSWLRFPSSVEIVSDRSVADCEESLRGLIAESAIFEDEKPYKGFVNGYGGEMRQRMLLFGILPARSLLLLR